MEAVEAHDGVGGSFGDEFGGPGGAVRAHELQVGRPVVEERPDGNLGATPRSSDDLAGDVVAHDREVLVALLVLDFVDGDGDERVEQVDPFEGLGCDADAHVATACHEVREDQSGPDG